MVTNPLSRNPVMAGNLRGRTARIVMTLLVLVVLGTAAFPGAASAQEIRKIDDDTGAIKLDESDLFKLKLPSGGELSFVPTYGPDGRLIGFGVAEMLPPGATSYLAVRELRGAGPAEIANAFLPDDMRIPREIIARYGRPTLGPRGWAADHPVFTDELTVSPCHTGSFQNDFPYHAQNRVVSYYDGIDTNPGMWKWDTVGPEYLNLHTRREADNVPSFFAKVTRCRVAGTQYTPAGPKVRLEAGQGGSPIFYVPMGSLPSYGSTVSFSWYIPSQYNVVMDWDLVIHSAWPGDQFHIGYGWANLSIK